MDHLFGKISQPHSSIFTRMRNTWPKITQNNLINFNLLQCLFTPAYQNGSKLNFGSNRVTSGRFIQNRHIFITLISFDKLRFKRSELIIYFPFVRSVASARATESPVLFKSGPFNFTLASI